MENIKCLRCGRFKECCYHADEERDKCRNDGYINYITEQQSEIETIKPRKIELSLSDADVERICKKAGECNMSVSQLLENFIGDLVAGTYSNGSDERDLAECWFERCGFGMFPQDTFLRHLIINCNIDSFLDDLEYLETMQDEVKYLQSEEHKQEQPDEKARAQEIQEAQGDVEDFTEKILDYYREYKEESKEPEEIKEALQRVKEWNQKREEMTK